MSESTFPFGGTAAETDETERRGTRRALLLVGGVVATLVLVASSYLLLTGEAEEESFTVPPAARSVTAPAPTPRAVVALPAAFDGDLGRNPFKALYVLPAGATDPQPSGGGATGTGGGATTPSLGTGAAPAPDAPTVGQPVVPPVAAPVAAPAPAPVFAPPPPVGAPVAPAAPTEREYALVLRSVRGEGEARRAAFTIDGTAVTAKVGDTFGPTKEIRLISLQEGPSAGQWTAVLQVGDGGPFDAVTGQAVPVR